MFVSADLSAPRNISVFTDTAIVATERQSGSECREITPVAAEYRLAACDRDDARRREAEAFVRRRFLRSHGAHVSNFMPTLLLLSDAHGELAAVAGLRCAADEPLFLERYLPVPIEQAIALRRPVAVSRAQILEIGNFAAADSRRARILMSFMPAWFLARSARWIAFTATSAIRALLATMGGRCLELAAAESTRAAGCGDEWGHYYSADPRVMAGYLPSARRIPALWRAPHGN